MGKQVELGFFLKRVWVFIPIFAGIIMIPVLFNVFTPGDALITLATLGSNAHLGPFALPSVITITAQGVMVALTSSYCGLQRAYLRQFSCFSRRPGT